MSLISKLKRFKIRLQPRYTEYTTTYTGFMCTMTDKSSFLYMCDEIFDKEIYRFETTEKQPFIIDCGANIGLSVIYFKRLFPNAEILAFEPDPQIYPILQRNLAAAKVEGGVTTVEAGLGESTEPVVFYSDGADGGSMIPSEVSSKVNTVAQCRLDAYMNRKIDFLKMDIEGAEYTVLRTIAPKLSLVDKIFIEYHSFSSEEQHLDDILAILKVAGFRYYIEHVGIRSPHVYIKRDTYHGMDMQVNIYAYRPESHS